MTSMRFSPQWKLFLAFFFLLLLLLLLVMPDRYLPTTGIPDPALHAAAFFVTGLLLAESLRGTFLPTMIMIAVAAAGEVLQFFSPGRNPDWIDLLAGLAGAFAGIALARVSDKLGRRGTAIVTGCLVPGVLVVGSTALPYQTRGATAEKASHPRHLAVNHGPDFASAAKVGFDLADIGSVSALNSVPSSAEAVLWVGNGFKGDCSWQLKDDELLAIIEKARGHPRFSGIYYIADEPIAKGCSDASARIAKRTALVHEHDPDGRTFITLATGSSNPEAFRDFAQSADLVGVVSYPCNVKNADSGCDWGKTRQRVQSALDAGIETARMVPVFQAFGQTCGSGDEWYRLPTPDETEKMFALWDELVPPDTRAFDMTYSWGRQERNACPALSDADGKNQPDLHSAYLRYFASITD